MSAIIEYVRDRTERPSPFADLIGAAIVENESEYEEQLRKHEAFFAAQPERAPERVRPPLPPIGVHPARRRKLRLSE